MLPGACVLFIVPATRTISLPALSDLRCTARRAPEAEIFLSDTGLEAPNTFLFFQLQKKWSCYFQLGLRPPLIVYNCLGTELIIDRLPLQAFEWFHCLHILLLMFAQLSNVHFTSINIYCIVFTTHVRLSVLDKERKQIACVVIQLNESSTLETRGEGKQSYF